MTSSLFETKDYPIFFEDLGFRALDESIRNSGYSGIFVLVDEHTFENCWPILHQRLSVVEGAHIIQTPSGEENKNLSNLWAGKISLQDEWMVDKQSIKRPTILPYFLKGEDSKLDFDVDYKTQEIRYPEFLLILKK